MSAIEVVRIPAEGAQLGTLARAVREARDGYLAAPRCERVQVLASGDAEELIVVLQWASTDAHDEAATEPAAAEFLGRVAELAAGPPAVGWYEDLG